MLLAYQTSPVWFFLNYSGQYAQFEWEGLMKRLMMVMAALIAVSGTAQADDSQFFIGFGSGVFGLEYSEAGFKQKTSTYGGFVKMGANYNDYLGVEVRVAATGRAKQSYSAGILGAASAFDYSLSSQFVSYLAKLQYPVTSDIRTYALFGGTTAKLKRTLSAPVIAGTLATDKTTETGFTYGAGAEYFVSDQLSLGAEWLQVWTDVHIASGITARIWTANGSLNYYF